MPFQNKLLQGSDKSGSDQKITGVTFGEISQEEFQTGLNGTPNLFQSDRIGPRGPRHGGGFAGQREGHREVGQRRGNLKLSQSQKSQRRGGFGSERSMDRQNTQISQISESGVEEY